jgi:hypothetical protein
MEISFYTYCNERLFFRRTFLPGTFSPETSPKLFFRGLFFPFIGLAGRLEGDIYPGPPEILFLGFKLN